MDLNNYRYMFPNQMISSRHGDPNTDDTRQWSHDVTGGDMQWHQSYRIGLAEDYNIQHPLHHQIHPGMGSPAVQAGYRPMHCIRRPQLENSRAITPYQRPVGPGSIYQYSIDGYSHNQSSVLRQLHPLNSQSRSVHPGMQMHRELQFDAPATRMIEPLPVQLMSHTIPASSSRPKANTTLELPKTPSAFSMSSTNLPAKRPSMENSTIATGPNKKFASHKELASGARETRRIERKNNIPADSPGKELKYLGKIIGTVIGTGNPVKNPLATSVEVASKVFWDKITNKAYLGQGHSQPIITCRNTSENKSTSQKSITRGVRFVTASVSDVLRWRKNHVFSDIERCNLVVEVVGTVFDIGGLKPVKISIHSQCIINGVFWETDLRLDRNAILPGCLVKVVLRITQDGKDFHFLKVRPLKDPSAAENAYRRIAYVTGSSIQQSKKK